MEGGIVVKGRVTIDTRPPFRSVKEAVALFGEKVLAGKFYSPMLDQETVESKSSEVKGGKNKIEIMGSMKTQLEETKQRLESSTEEKKTMENAIELLRQELVEKSRELEDLKSRKRDTFFQCEEPIITNPEIEDIKFVSNNEHVHSMMMIKYDAQQELWGDSGDDYDDERKVQVPTLKKFVSFASPPSLIKEIDEKKNQKKDEKKKPLGMGWLFPRKRRNA